MMSFILSLLTVLMDLFYRVAVAQGEGDHSCVVVEGAEDLGVEVAGEAISDAILVAEEEEAQLMGTVARCSNLLQIHNQLRL